MVLTGTTVSEILQEGTVFLANAGSESARLDAEVLLGHVLAWQRIDIVCRGSHVIAPEKKQQFEQLLTRRSAYEPVAYITGCKEFMGLNFAVSPSVLIPRADTELLVEEALAFLKTHKGPARVIDVCTGSGCIGISLAHYYPQATVFCSDISPQAIEIARKNAEKMGLLTRVSCQVGNLLDNFRGEQNIQLICANPPYIPPEEYAVLMPDVALYEPKNALLDDGDGLSFHRKLLQQALPLLCPGGKIILEIAYNQRSLIEKINHQGFLPPRIKNDYSGNDRCVIFEKES